MTGFIPYFHVRIVTALPPTYESSLSLLAYCATPTSRQSSSCDVVSVKIPVGVAGGTRGKGDKNEFYVRCVDRKHFTRVG